MVTHEEYIKANLVVEELIDEVDDTTAEKSKLMHEFLQASDAVEAYEEVHFSIGLPSLVEVIRLRMSEMKLKNKDLAVLLGTTPSRISEYLNGKREITLNVAKTMHHKLNIDSDIILNG